MCLILQFSLKMIFNFNYLTGDSKKNCLKIFINIVIILDDFINIDEIF